MMSLDRDGPTRSACPAASSHQSMPQQEVFEQMNARRAGTAVGYLIASAAIGIIAVGVGLLVSTAMGTPDDGYRALPVAVGILIAILGGACTSRLVPWLLGLLGLLREILSGDHGADQADTRSTGGQRQRAVLHYGDSQDRQRT